MLSKPRKLQTDLCVGVFLRNTEQTELYGMTIEGRAEGMATDHTQATRVCDEFYSSLIAPWSTVIWVIGSPAVFNSFRIISFR